MTLQRREKWLKNSTPVTEDPRRVPVLCSDAGDDELILKNGRVFDAVDGDLKDVDVVVRGNEISEICADAEKSSTDTQVVDLNGKTLMPGLIDLHTHLSYHEPDTPVDIAQSESDATLRGLERMRFFLESGITSVRDAGSHTDVPFRLKEWSNAGRILGPRVFASGCLITGTGGHGAEGLNPVAPSLGKIREASGPDDWREAAREQFKKGADVIKVASHFSRKEVEAAVDEAHTLGLRVMCDAETHYIDWAVEAGVDTIEHPLPRTDEAIEKMVEHNVASVPTLIPYMIIFDLHGGYFGSTSRRFSFSKDDNLKVLERMKEAGVKIGVGTDLVMNWFRAMPEAYITELKQYTHVGFSNEGALLAATRESAEILDMGDRLGTVESGKLADLLVIDGDPLKDLDDLAAVNMVIKDGSIVLQEGQLVIDRHKPLSLDDL